MVLKITRKERNNVAFLDISLSCVKNTEFSSLVDVDPCSSSFWFLCMIAILSYGKLDVNMKRNTLHVLEKHIQQLQKEFKQVRQDWASTIMLSRSDLTVLQQSKFFADHEIRHLVHLLQIQDSLFHQVSAEEGNIKIVKWKTKISVYLFVSLFRT